MMPMLRISDRAVVRGIADFHDSFRVTSERPIRAVAAGLLGSAAAVNSFVLLLVSRALAIPRACHMLAALGPSPGSRGVGGQLRMIAISCQFHEPWGQEPRAASRSDPRHLYWVRQGLFSGR